MRFLRQRFSQLKPYHASYITEGVLLNANESPYEPPQALKDYLAAHINDLCLNRYPDSDSTALKQAIANVYGVKKENVVCGVGSDELIDCLMSSMIDPEDQVLIPDPSFSMYQQFTCLNSGRSLKVPLKSDFSYDVTAIKQAILKNQPKMIFLCNPNNPTGCILRREEIEEVLQVAKGLVVVDEAYEDFSTEDITSVPLVTRYENLIVLRTFSKAYALAGIRAGYGIASQAVIDLLHTVLVPYNLNQFSQMVATWAINHREVFLGNAKKIMGERAQLVAGLKALGVTVYPSEANFIWAKLPEDIFETLEERKIYIRQICVEGEVYARITIGSPEENKALLMALKQLMK